MESFLGHTAFELAEEIFVEEGAIGEMVEGMVIDGIVLVEGDVVVDVVVEILMDVVVVLVGFEVGLMV